MSQIETIQAAVGKMPGDIDATPILSGLYGPSSLVCHMVRPIDERTFDAYFLVGQNICGPNARPPMFNRLAIDGDRFVTHTEEDDAKEHLIINVGEGVVPGHNLAGLFFEAEKLALNQGRPIPREYMVRSYDFIRFKGLVLPSQGLIIAGPERQRNQTMLFTLSSDGENRGIAGNIKLEAVDLTDEEIESMMYQHWYPEITAQGLGIAKAHLLKAKKIPLFLEVAKSSFELIPVRYGDLVRTRLSLFDSEDNQAFANSQTFVSGSNAVEWQVAEQEEVLLEFFPMEEVFGTIKP